jgi:hypothetical protein
MKTPSSFKLLSRVFLTALAATALTLAANAQIASDSAGDGVYSGGWTNGTNGGTGFGAWAITSVPGTGGSAGTFIGDPAAASIVGMSATSFGLYANPSGSGASVNADRSFSSALAIGQVFSLQWGMNWDSGANGSKGFSIFSGGVEGTELVNVNNGDSSVITVNGENSGLAYGAHVMTWSFLYKDAATLSVSATGRDGVGGYTVDIVIAAAPDALHLYAYQMQAGNEPQPYFNNLSIDTIPEPTTYALFGLGALVLSLQVIRRRKQA